MAHDSSWQPWQDHFFLEATTDEIDYIEGNGGVVGVAKDSPECFRRLMDLYDRGHVPAMATPGPDGPRVVQMGFRDGPVEAENTTDNSDSRSESRCSTDVRFL